MDFSEIIKYGWIVISGVFVWLFKNLDGAWKSKIERLEKENDKTEARVSKLEHEVIRLDSKKITREDLDNLMATHFSHFEKALQQQQIRMDQRFDDLKESIDRKNSQC